MLPLFPESSLDNSILTSVLVGLLVVWALQETLGWNFTGLVVPGYLASILAIDTTTGLVVVVESLATFAVVTAVSDRVPRWWPWSPLFGRDRFLLFLVASVAVRVLLEGGGFDWLRAAWGIEVEGGVYSMGLVVVPLLANALWRAGAAGALRVAVPIGVTWAVVSGVLLPHTNLSLSSFELTYEDLALDFVGSPRAYVVLLVGATMGSWANQRWGWDYGGIIVPGLLALCWWEPLRVLSTLGEAVVIAGLLLLVLKLPGLRTANLTGGRPIVLAYVLGYGAKFLLATVVGDAFPSFRVRDLFGFGYLLSSLLALRFVKHGEIWRAAIPAVVTSFTAFVAASGLAWVLAMALPTAPPPAPAPLPPLPEEPRAAVLAAAWRDEGPVPELTPRDAEAVLAGGDGFGGLWFRPEGRPLAVVATVGPLALEATTAAIGEALDARVVLLCAEAGPTCADTTEALGRHLALLTVTDGEHTALVDAPAAVDPAALAPLLGPLRTAPGDGAATLAVAAPDRLRVAAGWLDALPAPGPGAVRPPSEPGELRRLRGTLLAALAAVPAGATAGDDALRVASGFARGLGLSLRVAEPALVLEGAGWRAEHRPGGRPLVVDVPHAAPGSAAERVGRHLAHTLDVALLVEAAPQATLTTEERTAWTHALALAALERLGPSARGVTVRSVPRSQDPGADVVLSEGRRMPAGSALPPLFAELRDLFVAGGHTVALYDGAAQRVPFSDPGNPLRAAARANGGEGAHATVYVGPTTLGGGAVVAEAP